MPKGVEHNVHQDVLSFRVYVKTSPMPKGVEHMQLAPVRCTISASEDLSDAERR